MSEILISGIIITSTSLLLFAAYHGILYVIVKSQAANLTYSYRHTQWITKTKTSITDVCGKVKSVFANTFPLKDIVKHQEALMERQQQMFDVLALVVLKLNMKEDLNSKTDLLFPSFMSHRDHGPLVSDHGLVQREVFHKHLEHFKTNIKGASLDENLQHGLFKFLHVSASVAVLECQPEFLPCFVGQLHDIIDTFQEAGTHLTRAMKGEDKQEHSEKVQEAR